MKTRRTFSASSRLTVLGLSLGMLALPLAAQDMQPSAEEAAAIAAMQKAATPGSQHAFLAKQVGTFNATIKTWMDPSAPPMVSEGTAERTMILGGRVLEERFQANVMGMSMEGIAHTGYDNVTGKYWSTWTDNMSTGVVVMKGTMDEATGKATFEGESADPMSGNMFLMRIEMRQEDGKEVSDFYMPGPEGESMKTMEIVYVKQ